MNKSLLLIGLGLLLVRPAPVLLAADANVVSLTGHVPAALAHMQSNGHLADTNLDLAIGLPLRNREVLTNLLEQITDPHSSIYHKFLNPGQFANLFGPSDADYQAVADFATAHGLKVTRTYPNHLLLDVSGRSSDIEKAFNISLNTYQHPTEKRNFFAPSTEPSVPSNLKIQDISGLNNIGHARPKLLTRRPGAMTNLLSKAFGKAHPQVGSGPFGLYMGNDFRNAYATGAPQTGAGQTIAMVEFDGYNLSDIQEYETLAGRTNVPLSNVLLDGFNGQPTGDGNEVEVSLDIEMAIAMAPALADVVVYEAPDTSPQNDVLNRIASDDTASQISCSWGFPGGPSTTTDAIFQQMALQGQTFLTAAGDYDAYPAGTVDSPFGQGAPADDPYVTSVGGTTLTMDPTSTIRVSETVWNWLTEYGIDGIGSSGGISTYYAIPFWQTNVSMTVCQGSVTNRNFPDVAMTADNILVIADGGLEYDEAGTSCATPLWAAFVALVNQQEASFSNPPIGFINPALYAIGHNPLIYTNCFNDITNGNNEWSGSPTLFTAVTNYDLCTGLGTPNGTNLINALVSGPVYIFHVSPPPPVYGTNLNSVNGTTPDGPWYLFIQDNDTLNSGVINNGWNLALTLGNPVGAEADLGLSLAASATNVWPGSNVIYYLTITNYGGLSTATNVVVQDNLPTDATLLSSNASLGTVTLRGSVVYWALGNLITNAGGSLALTVRTANTTENILNYALATENTPDPNSDDGSAYLYVNVGYPSAPQLTPNYTLTNGVFKLTVNSEAASTIIQASTNLVNWVPIWTNSASVFTFTDSNRMSFRYRFFRAVAAP